MLQLLDEEDAAYHTRVFGVPTGNLTSVDNRPRGI